MSGWSRPTSDLHHRYDLDNRFFNPALGGGAFLDVGVYTLSFAIGVLGAPQRIVSSAAMGPSGVDEQSCAVLTYADGRMAVLAASLKGQLPSDAVISGTRGEIRLAPIFRPEQLTLRQFAATAAPPAAAGWKAGVKAVPGLRATVTLGRRLIQAVRPASESGNHVPFEGNGFNYEAAEVMRCLREGILESPIMPLNETLLIMECLDQIRSLFPSPRVSTSPQTQIS